MGHKAEREVTEGSCLELEKETEREIFFEGGRSFSLRGAFEREKEKGKREFFFQQKSPRSRERPDLGRDN